MHYWQKGKHLNSGKYIVEELLGGGGYGVTYKIKNTSNNEIYALKTLNNKRQQQADSQQLQYQFINEIITLANCRHPNVVKVYSQTFSENEFPCMVMDYIEGKDLAQWLNTTGKFAELDAIDIVIQVGKALSYVHSRGFLHRDIKPANILLQAANLSPVLIDFGLAREYSTDLRSMTNAKTECFAPIEQYDRNGNFGTWTDVYALAATLYVLVTGELPIPATYRKYAPLTSPKQLNANISDKVNKAILQGMELEPENRPQSVEQWLELLPVSLPNHKAESTTNTTSQFTTLQIPTVKEPTLDRFKAKIKQRVGDLEFTGNSLHNCDRLEDLLENQQWQEADRETIDILLDLTKRKKYGSLRDRDIANISATDLSNIDLLWLEASNNHFGFTIQRRIWQKKLGLELAPKQFRNSENLRDFGRLLGWYEDSKLIENRDRYQFSLAAPQGHLPSLRFPCSEFPDLNWWQSWKRILSVFLLQTEKYT